MRPDYPGPPAAGSFVHGTTTERALCDPTPDDLRKYADEMEARQRAARNAAKAKARNVKAAAKRNRIALDALVRVAQGADDMAAVEAARTILNGAAA